MKQQALSFFTDTQMTALGLILFFIVFIGFTFFTYHKSRKEIYSQIAQMPLKDEEFT